MHRTPFMLSALLTGLLLGLLVPSLSAQETPLQRAKPEDYVELDGVIPALETLKGLGGLPGLEGLGPLGNKLKIRYQMTSKSETTAKVVVSIRSGDADMGTREIELPLDKPVDPILLTPTSDEKVKIKFERTVPNLKYKIGDKEFSGAAHVYKVEMALFGNLEGKGLEGFDIPGLEGLKAVSEKSVMELSYFMSDEAPLMGIVAMKMTGVAQAKFELARGTGVEKLIPPTADTMPGDTVPGDSASTSPGNPAPSGESMASDRPYKVGDWLEYQGTEKVSKKPAALRHIVKEVGDKSTLITAILSIDDQQVSTWDFEFPVADVVTILPQWEVIGDLSNRRQMNKSASKNVKFKLLESVEVAGVEESYTITLDTPGKPDRVLVNVGASRLAPLTGLVSVRMRHNTAVDLQLTLADQSGFVVLPEKPATKSKTK